MNIKRIIHKSYLFGLIFVSLCAGAQVIDLETRSGDSYYYVDHFETTIDKPVNEVWPYILQMGKWIPWMANGNPDGKISEGQRVNLYGDFYIEVETIIPEKMVLLANLPNADKGEQSQGIAMVSVAENDGKTVVSLFMSRIYYWFDSADNAQKKTRETPEFAKKRREMFKDNFLAELKGLAEG